MGTEPTAHRHYRIRGRVQGVGFRHFVWCEAKDRGVFGWVRNRRDGSVEVLATARAVADLDVFEQALERGPRWGRVDAFEKTGLEKSGESHPTFEIRTTV